MKTKLTPELQEEIIKKLKIGMYAKIVAQSVGIGERTYYYWLERGQKALELQENDKDVPENEKIFLQFLQSVRQSEAEGEAVLVAAIFGQIGNDWKAAMEILARKYPERWARKEYVDFKGEIEDKASTKFKDFKDNFKGIPKSVLSEISRDLVKKLRDAKNRNDKKKDNKS